MLENRAPPDKFGVLYSVLHGEFHNLAAGSVCQGYDILVPGINFFLQMVWIPLNNSYKIHYSLQTQARAM